jgi:membrane protease YdiL (CAAX protease family)
LRDCLWASVPAALVAALGLLLRFKGPQPSAELLVNPVVLIVASALSAATLLAPMYVIAIRKRRARLADLGFLRAPLGDSVRLAAAAFLMNSGASSWWGQMARYFGIALQPDGLAKFGTGLTGFLFALVLGAVIAPVVEETFFRGFLFPAFRKKCPFWMAASASGLIFGAVHLVPGAIVPLSAAGFLWAWLRERTGSIWPPMATHALNNALYYTVWFAAQHHR